MIYSKISLDHILKISNNLELLKEVILDEEEFKKINELPPRNLNEQIAQMEISNLSENSH